MIKPSRLKKGDKVAIVSLSDGVLGESFVEHEIILLEARLKKEFGLDFVYMDNARKGIDYIKKHPEARADDLKQAFLDKDVNIIWTSIGGDDTFKILPFLMNDEFKKIVKENPKIFIGMSDTTNNHLMLYQIGLMTYYGPSILGDVAELGPEIFPFTKKWLFELFDNKKNIEIKASPLWYLSRKSFGPDQLGISREQNNESRGHEFIYGSGKVTGRLLGGCLDSLYEMLVGGRYDDQPKIFNKYHVFPKKDEWRNKIIFLETSEEHPDPEKYRKMLKSLENRGVFEEVAGMIVGKPQDEMYYKEYKEALLDIANKHDLPTVYNVNFGHTTPRIILPYGGLAEIDFTKKTLVLKEGLCLT